VSFGDGEPLSIDEDFSFSTQGGDDAASILVDAGEFVGVLEGICVRCFIW